MAEIKVQKDIRSLNDETAAANREVFNKHGIFAVNIMGSPGAGKTTLLENILPELAGEFRTVVIEGDLETQCDAERIRNTGVRAYQINTNGGCHLDARMIEKEIQSIDLDDTELLIIENVGNLVCPISFYLGENLRLVVLSTPEGEDKPLKYPPAMLKTDAVVVTKTDIAQYVDVDTEKLAKNIADINPKAQILYAGKENGVYSAQSTVEFIKKQIKDKSAAR